MKRLIATRNIGKLRELVELLGDVPFELVSLDDVGIDDEVEETGDTFEENAALKAETYARLSGLPTLADDSGLEVDALDGEPGVLSARYGGDPNISDQDRVSLLLNNLKDIPWEKRTARFRCVVALATPAGEVLATAEGTLEGVIRRVEAGSGGFGYDGDLSLNILIRTFVVREPQVSFHVGGGIVADSDPELEYQGTLDKARALVQALGGPA